jgi:hypothetical protein
MGFKCWWLPAVWFGIALQAQNSPFREPEIHVAPSPSEAHELALAAGESAADLCVWSDRPEAVLIVRRPDGKFEARSWRIGSSAPAPMMSFDPGFEPRAIACHPVAKRFFVSGRSAGQSVILAVEPQAGVWHARTIYRTGAELERLLVSPRPYLYTDSTRQVREKYRLVFARRLSDGNYSTRTVTETGDREYQIVGPKGATVKLPEGPEVEALAEANFASSARPAAFHPAGHLFLWQDGRGCFQQLAYSSLWEEPSGVAGSPCGGSLAVTPNGAFLLHWRKGQAGIAVVNGRDPSPDRQAKQYTFLFLPSSVADGKGIVGVTEASGSQTIVYTPIAVPLANVINAWMFDEGRADQQLFTNNAGLFRQRNATQLFELDDTERYPCSTGELTTPERPILVTTDILWEIAGAAYEGMFIVQERQQAITAFWSFVDSANAALRAKFPASPWAIAFAAVAAVHSGNIGINPEAARIFRAADKAFSPAFGRNFDFAELKPRGHYASSGEMGTYFKAVHYLTALASPATPPGPDVSILATLPDEVRNKAIAWVRPYQAYIAPSRAPLVWNAATIPPPGFARHLLQRAQVFPLSWGFDNEVLLSTVYHPDWPPAERIQKPQADEARGPEGKRLIPSGLDLGAAVGSAFARSLLKDDLQDYPNLGPALDALAARKPANGQPTNLYDTWLSGLATQWADSVSFPGMNGDQSLWRSKRLQTGLASWATLRHATVLVNERSEAEAGEGGFEELVLRPPRGYVEPDPKTFDAIAALFDDMSKVVTASASFRQGTAPVVEDGVDQARPLREGILRRLRESADKSRLFARIADKELRGEELTPKEYEEILYVSRVAEHNLLVFKSLANKDLALSTPDPMMKIADVADGGKLKDGGFYGILEAAVGRPVEWDQIAPFFGRREIVKGSVYSYYEFVAPSPMNDEEWRKQVDRQPHPAWINPFFSQAQLSCPAKPPF